MFDPMPLRDTRPIALLKRAMLIFVAAHVVILGISGYRAYFQVHSLELKSTTRILHKGSAIETGLVSYARTPVYLRIEMIQGGHAETLGRQTLLPNEWSLYDPRTQSGELTITLTPELLARFQAGAAVVRATAVGCPQWTRLPPPVVRELAVEIQRQP